MSFLLSVIATSMLQSAAAPLPSRGWVWTLYENDGPVVVLADEVPDTPHLRATFECTQNSGQVRLTHYQTGSAHSGPATVSAGPVKQDIPAEVEDGRLTLGLRAASPLFQSLINTGQLNLSLADHSADIRFDRQSLPRLRRFAQLCAG